MKSKKIFLFGAGLHAQTCIDTIEKQDKYELVGIIDSIKKIGSLVDGYKVIGRIEDLLSLMDEHKTFAGIIGIGDNWIRKKLVNEIHKQACKFEFVNIIHPTAVFGKNITLGKGIFVGAQCFISSSCIIGDFSFLHQKAHLGLQNKIGDFASISLGSITGGAVTIGQFTAITLAVIIHDRINIGSHSIIGSGSLVLKDIPDNVIAYGNPTKIIRKRINGEVYLKSS